MSSPCTLSGGAFQDSEGNVLANGTIKFVLSQDATVNTDNICSGISVTFDLDSSGNIAAGSQIWGNDVLSPVNTFYKVTAYTSKGQPAWGPNNQQVTGTSFNLGSWIPNQVISWTPAVTSVELQTNGTDNSSQAKLNLENGTGITVTDTGNGNIQISASSGTVAASWMLGAGVFSPSGIVAIQNGEIVDAADRVYAAKFMTPYSLSFTKLNFWGYSSLGGGGYVAFAIYNSSGTLVWTSPTFSIPNSAGQAFSSTLTGFPTLSPGTYYLAWTASNTNTAVYGWSVGGTTNASIFSGGTTVVYGYSPNAATLAGSTFTFPSSLGTLSATTATTIIEPAVMFTP